MSMYYTIKEHLHVENTEVHKDVAVRMQLAVSLLGAAMLRGEATVDKAVVIADGEAFAFRGKRLNEAFHRMTEAMADAVSLDVELCYGYVSYEGCEEEGPFALERRLAEVAKADPRMLDGLFYSMYRHADCAADGKGVLVAYGRQGDCFHRGVVASRAVAALPDGVWYAPMTAACPSFSTTPCFTVKQSGKCLRRSAAACLR